MRTIWAGWGPRPQAVPFKAMVKRLCSAFAASLLLAALAATPASADSIMFSLSERDAALGGLSGPFVDVTIDQPNRPTQLFVTLTSHIS